MFVITTTVYLSGSNKAHGLIYGPFDTESLAAEYVRQNARLFAGCSWLIVRLNK